jgi:hypothetical protein
LFLDHAKFDVARVFFEISSFHRFVASAAVEVDLVTVSPQVGEQAAVVKRRVRLGILAVAAELL